MARRELLRAELRLQRQFLDRGFITRAQYLRNVAVRSGYRLVPRWMQRVPPDITPAADAPGRSIRPRG